MDRRPRRHLRLCVWFPHRGQRCRQRLRFFRLRQVDHPQASRHNCGFCEFGEAVLLGASVTSTVRGKLFDTDLYENEPEVLMFGMFTSLFSANVWLFIATYFGMPVSTTHDVVGCILGFALASKGFSAIHWDVVVKIFISWFASPLVAGTIAAIFIFFSLVKKFVMRAENPYERAYYTFPLVLTLGIG